MAIFTLTHRMQYDGTNIDFPALRDTLQPDDLDHIIHIDKAGGIVTYIRASDLEWRVDVICTKAQADTTFRAWITARRTVAFYPDLTGAPATSHNCQIMNARFPFAPWGQGKWRGMVVLRKE